MADILVSICCITYNHEKYISEAIDSFLMQKTNFNYEILIHDDASTDKTAEIIRNYEKRYPDLIKPVYQTENQHSKGTCRIHNILWEKAKGQYIAVCEGDDYWTDPNKLQKQIDYMTKHPECSLCVHATSIESNGKNCIEKIQPSTSNRIFSTEEVILGGGGLFSTNSMIFPSHYSKNMPEFYKKAPVGDYPLVIYLSMLGTVYYLSETMAVYRKCVPGSWTLETAKSPDRQIAFFEKMVKTLDAINEYSQYKYNDTILKAKLINEMEVLIVKSDLPAIRSDKFKDIYKSLPLILRLKIHLRYYMPGLYAMLKSKKFKRA